MIRSIKRKVRKFCMRWMLDHPEDLVLTLGLHYGPETTNLSHLENASIPAKVDGFHDLAYLFACNKANRGVISQDFDEAAYIWKTIVTSRPLVLLEIGRWLGGGTVLHAAAAALHGGKLTSVDLKKKMPAFADDKVIQKHLTRLGLSNVDIIIADSREFQPTDFLDYVFIDGDHSYEGVKGDYENIISHLKTGGDLLLHDSCATRPYATLHEPVARLMRELRHDSRVVFQGELGSISHFKTTGKAAT